MGGQQSTEQSYYYSYSSASECQPTLTSSSYHARNEFQQKYQTIGDNFTSLDQVVETLREAGLESSNLIVGIDFTKSNQWTGAKCFNRRSLHHLGNGLNPYEHAISIIGRTLTVFDEDNLIPCFGFGDVTTHDQDVFSFYPDNRPCNGFEEALTRYREIVPHIHLSGPTSFAPIIETAIGIVDDSGGQYHVLLIIADGQVPQNEGMDSYHPSPQERNTIDAIVKASGYPLSIVLVGVGDGPWDMMRKFDDSIPARSFDNFQFVNFTEIMLKNVPQTQKEAEFALAALMEIPQQYQATLSLGLLGNRRGNLGKKPLPPKLGRPMNYPDYFSKSRSLENNGDKKLPGSAGTRSNAIQCCCPVCSCRKKDLALGCGHQTCYDCGRDLACCPTCGMHITTRIRLL
nr:E3 ubiquitin-protein ligase RGLG1-like [Ipomoea trifida]